LFVILSKQKKHSTYTICSLTKYAYYNNMFFFKLIQYNPFSNFLLTLLYKKSAVISIKCKIIDNIGFLYV